MKRFGARGEVCRFGFTLIELLVVISIISLLLAILVPLSGRAKEQVRRTVCSNHVRQFIAGIYIYAHDAEGWFPSGFSDSDDEHIPVLSRKIRNTLAKIIGDHRILSCPWLKKPFSDPDGWYESPVGYVIGYCYLGGHEGTPWPLGQATDEWISPLNSTSTSGNVEIVTELNAWSPGYGYTFAPHGKRGPILQANGSTNQAFDGIPSEEIGAAGGNIGLVDGSVSWKRISEMKVYRGSRLNSDACYAAW